MLVLFVPLAFPAYASASQDNSGIINLPPPNVPPPSATLPPGYEPRTEQQAAPPDPQQPDVLDRIMQTYPDKIDIKQENRSDLSTCDATEGEAMLIALYNCWPLLEGFQTYYQAKKISRDHRLARRDLAKKNPDYRGSEDYKADQEVEYEDAILSAKKIEALAGKREYPMQDMLLFLANIMQSVVAQKKEDYDTALAHLDNSIMLFETTRITEPEFADLAALKKERKRMAERRELPDK